MDSSENNRILNFEIQQVKCAHVLYKRKRKTQMTYPEVGEAALEFGPQALRRYATCFRQAIYKIEHTFHTLH